MLSSWISPAQVEPLSTRHVIPDTWYLMGVVLSAGAAWSWYRDRFAPDLAGLADSDARLTAEAATVPAGALGVTFLPYLQGERTPHRDAAARGGFFGLTLAHTRAHLSRAVLEGITFALKDSLELIRELGGSPAEVLLTGGGAKSPFIRQLEAAIFGLPVRATNRQEGPAYGAALLAAVGIGWYPDCAGAVSASVTHQPALTAAPAECREYLDPYRRFRAGYQRSRSAPNA